MSPALQRSTFSRVFQGLGLASPITGVFYLATVLMALESYENAFGVLDLVPSNIRRTARGPDLISFIDRFHVKAHTEGPQSVHDHHHVELLDLLVLQGLSKGFASN